MDQKNAALNMNTQILEEATAWLIKQRSAQLEGNEKQVFDAWLRQSPEHVRAYFEMSSLWEDVSLLDPTWNASAEDLIAQARTEDNVVSLSPVEPLVTEIPRASNRHSTQSRVRWFGRRRTLRASGVAAALLVVIGWFAFNHDPTFTTAVGEQRTLVLEDGSMVELNAKSRIRLRFTERVRHIELMEGQALFRVAKYKSRPFVVSSDRAQVRAIGTQFDVYKKRNGTVVTVLEGKVEVAEEDPSHSSQAKPVPLAAGEQAIVEARRLLRPKRVNIAAATSWRHHSLIFESAPLTEVADEFNRYNTRPLLIKDSGLIEFRVSGVFSSVDPALLLKFLRAQPGIVVTETEKEIRISRP